MVFKRAAISIAERKEDGGRGQDDGRQAAENKGQSLVELEFYCRTPGLDEEPVVLSVSYGGRVLDQIAFLGEPKKEKTGTNGLGGNMSFPLCLGRKGCCWKFLGRGFHMSI